MAPGSPPSADDGVLGKTHLLSHAWNADARLFYFLAAALTPELNRHDLVRELAAWSGRALDPADYLPGAPCFVRSSPSPRKDR